MGLVLDPKEQELLENLKELLDFGYRTIGMGDGVRHVPDPHLFLERHKMAMSKSKTRVKLTLSEVIEGT